MGNMDKHKDNDPMDKWISLRNRWPEEPGTYKVRDCRNEVEGIGEYDGFDFQKQEFHNVPMRGALILPDYFVTHWMPMKHECPQ